MPENITHLVVEYGVAPVAFLLMLAVGLSLERPILAAALRPSAA